MKKILIFITILFLISSCKTKQATVVEKKFICANDSFEYLACIEEQVQYAINKNEKPTNEGMNYILNSCCEYANALNKAKKILSLSDQQSKRGDIK